jgi:hypothetical protein
MNTNSQNDAFRRTAALPRTKQRRAPAGKTMLWQDGDVSVQSDADEFPPICWIAKNRIAGAEKVIHFVISLRHFGEIYIAVRMGST